MSKILAIMFHTYSLRCELQSLVERDKPQRQFTVSIPLATLRLNSAGVFVLIA